MYVNEIELETGFGRRGSGKSKMHMYVQADLPPSFFTDRKYFFASSDKLGLNAIHIWIRIKYLLKKHVVSSVSFDTTIATWS